MAERLNCKTLDDWYNVTVDDIHQCGGGGLLSRVFNGSLFKALQSIYPDHEWHPWKLRQKLPIGYFNDIENQRFFFDWLGKKLNFLNMQDWYSINREEILKNGGGNLLQKYKGSPSRALESTYPEHKWITWQFNHKPKGFWDE